MKYNHAYSFGFSLYSNDPAGEDITAKQARAAIIEYLEQLSDDELLENLGCPFDTYEMEE